MNLNVTFGNVVEPRKLIYTAGNGVTAGTWVLWAVPQAASIQPYGDLFFTDGTLSMTLTNCKVGPVYVEFGVNGPTLKITGTDRRVYWNGKAIDGRYNVRGPDGTIVSGTEKTPRELATLLWTAMGEPSANSDVLPTDDRPEVNWECDDAASELEHLCARYDCEPTLNLHTDTAEIVEHGEGAELPTNTDVRWTQEMTQGVLPTRVEACSGYVLIQSKLKLRAVLRDTDGQWKLADDVSYAPDDGWAGTVSDLDEPLQPDNASYTEEAAELAKDLWKVWRVESFADDTLKFGPLGEVDSREDLLPISDTLITPYSENDVELGTDAYLVGTAAVPHDPDLPTTNTEEGSRIAVPFDVDAARGFIRTSTAVPKVNDDNELAEADLFLVCAHSFRDTKTGQYVRYVRTQSPNGFGGVFTARRPDITPTLTGLYEDSNDHTILTGISDNSASVNALLDQEISWQIQQHAPRTAYVREYNGVQAIAPDGTIWTVLWYLDSEPNADDKNCYTLAFWNTEGGPSTFQRERRRQQLSRHLDGTRHVTSIKNRRANRRRAR